MALATGAKAVLIGRAYAYGLGAGGEAGVTKAFDIIRGDRRMTITVTLGPRPKATLDVPSYAR